MVTERNDYRTEKNGNVAEGKITEWLQNGMVTERNDYRTEKNGNVAERK